MKSFKQFVDEACWKNYKMVGTKKKGGKTVPNCVPKEENVEEKMDPTKHVVEKGGKFSVVNLNGKIVKTFDNKKEADAYAIKFHDKLMDRIEEKSAAWQRKAGKNKEGGLNAKGRASYERENPGSDLKAPVSAAQAKKSKGGKAAKRRKSFCARMGGMPGAMKDSKGKPTRKALALRKWDC
jgi:non-homologous end joining protein Ku